ncbi:MAG: hypothetical protein LBE25_06050 [Arthrobacter sp.]|jgi:hypothetical protein|nr:hypothetical protein [Arthrobacter sp.]
MSTHRTKLAAAVEVFKELGWSTAATQDAARLPLGTPEQRATARAGLASGAWSRWGQDEKGRWGEHSFIDVDQARLALFATRQGVSVRRAARLLEAHASQGAIAEVVEERGAAFASAFVDAVSVPAHRLWEGAFSAFARHTLPLVAGMGLPIPENTDYLRDFALLAARSHAPASWPDAKDLTLPGGAELLPGRFAEHVRLAVELGVPAVGPLPDALRLGLERGWLGREEASGLALLGLQTAQRPSDRKAWCGFLAQPLALTPEELAAHADELVPVLSLGEGPLIEALAPPLIAAVTDEQLPEVALGALTVTTAKGRRVVLAALSGRGAPAAWSAGGADGLDELVAEIVRPWAGSRDRVLAKAAAVFLGAWGLGAPETRVPDAAGSGGARGVAAAPGGDTRAGGTAAGGDTRAGAGNGAVGQEAGRGAGLDAGRGTDRAVPGAWLPTPPVWEAPELILDPPGPEAFRAAVAALGGRVRPDVEGETFLAQLVALARHDEELARAEVLALPAGSWEVDQAQAWARGEERPNYWGDPETLLGWRDLLAVATPGAVPVLLSTPSRVDGSVSGEALLTRLRRYAAEGASAREVDLLAALLRLDHASVSRQQREELRALEVPVLTIKGKETGYTAGELAAGHVGDPVIEPGWIRRGRAGGYSDGHIKRQRYETPASLKRASFKLAEAPQYAYRDDPFTLMPFWGDALHGGASYGGANPEAWVWRQLARRAAPLSPGTALNLLTVQRDGLETQDGAGRLLALREAWERGLLRPGAAEARYLDWAHEPQRLASVARTLLGLGLEEGLASVVWPVLDDFLSIAGAHTRLLAGASELAEAVLELTPGAIAALGSGLAEPRALRLPGLRDMAERSGSSRAVRAAKEAAELLDAALLAHAGDVAAAAGASAAPGEPGARGGPAASGRDTAAPRLSEAAFLEAWGSEIVDPPVLDDGVEVDVLEAADGSSTRLLVLLRLPGEAGSRFVVDKGSYFADLVEQHAFQADALSEGADPTAPIPPGTGERRKLRWDREAGRLEALKFSGKTADLAFPQSFVSLVLALVAQPGRRGASALDAVAQLCARHELGPTRVAAAARVLLTRAAVSPARLAAAVGKAPGLLGALWPLLTEPVAHAAALEGAPPRWLGGVLDAALDHAPVLREAACRGVMPARWDGLEELAARPGTATALKKARQLKEALA